MCCVKYTEWYHGDYIGTSEIQGRLTERSQQEFFCPFCKGEPAKSKYEHDQVHMEGSEGRLMAKFEASSGDSHDMTSQKALDTEPEKSMRPNNKVSNK